jgi:hypothetical protein
LGRGLGAEGGREAVLAMPHLAHQKLAQICCDVAFVAGAIPLFCVLLQLVKNSNNNI